MKLLILVCMVVSSTTALQCKNCLAKSHVEFNGKTSADTGVNCTDTDVTTVECGEGQVCGTITVSHKLEKELDFTSLTQTGKTSAIYLKCIDPSEDEEFKTECKTTHDFLTKVTKYVVQAKYGSETSDFKCNVRTCDTDLCNYTPIKCYSCTAGVTVEIGGKLQYLSTGCDVGTDGITAECDPGEVCGTAAMSLRYSGPFSIRNGQIIVKEKICMSAGLDTCEDIIEEEKEKWLLGAKNKLKCWIKGASLAEVEKCKIQQCETHLCNVTMSDGSVAGQELSYILVALLSFMYTL